MSSLGVDKNDKDDDYGGSLSYCLEQRKTTTRARLELEHKKKTKDAKSWREEDRGEICTESIAERKKRVIQLWIPAARITMVPLLLLLHRLLLNFLAA